MSNNDLKIEGVIDELKVTGSKEECLRIAYDILTSRFHGKRIKTYLKLHYLFIRDPEKLWKSTDFLN